MTADNNLYKININEPRWSQETYIGRAKHFFAGMRVFISSLFSLATCMFAHSFESKIFFNFFVVTNPMNILLSGKALDDAREIVLRHRCLLLVIYVTMVIFQLQIL